jgi:hypothetical protein
MFILKHILNYNLLIINFLSALILIFTSAPVLGQLFDSSQNPTGIKWMQIQSEHFQLIYPTAIENEAQRLAAILDGLVEKMSASLKKETK